MSLDKVTVVVSACCNLHNMCIDDFFDERPEIDPGCLNMLRGKLPECHLHSNSQDEDYNDWKKKQKKRKSRLRDELRYEIQKYKLNRPVTSENGNNAR